MIISRRQFIQITGYSVISSGLILLTPEAKAVWPWIVRFIISSSGRRAVASTASRGIVSNTIRQANTYKNILDLGLTANKIIFSVSPNIQEQIAEYKAEAIWINSVKNEFSLSLQNTSNQRKQAQLSYILKDVNTGHIDLKHQCGFLSVGPHDQFTFPFEISELPYTGIKRLEALSDSDDLQSIASGNIIVANSNEIKFNNG